MKGGAGNVGTKKNIYNIFSFRSLCIKINTQNENGNVEVESGGWNNLKRPDEIYMPFLPISSKNI